ncbi:Beta-arrestin-1 [Fasciola gigantica]|uniref:Beta-arrestin-1 n=1 Tax=Fasciola gigantica TaxID=46835 RepID=A0A504YWF1_FASGI|nr:Beta-arrestin-1 [Fasciola gigantica]
MEENPRSGTRIFKKSTPNGKLTIYLGKRDFSDHLSHVDPVEGVVLLDPEYVKDRKVFIHLLGAFCYGRDEVDLLGLSYHKDIYLSTKQVYQPTPLSVVGHHESSDGIGNALKPNEPSSLTRLQERLIRKLSGNAHPFYFQLSPYSAPSISLNLSPLDSGKHCRVDYELKVCVEDEQDDKPQKRFSISDVCLELPFILTHPNLEENRLNDREPEVDEVFSLSMPADLTAPVGLPVALMQLAQQPPRTPNSLPCNTRPHSSSPSNRLHEQPSNTDRVAVIGNMVNGDHHRNPVEETTISSQKHLVLHLHKNSAVAAPGRAHTIAGNGSACASDQFPLRMLIQETVDNDGNVQTINTINKSGISVHTDTHYAVDHSTRSVSMFQANHSPALFSSVGHAVTLPLVAGQSSITSAQYIPSSDVIPFMINPTDCGVLTSVGGLNSAAGGSLTHGPAPRPPTRHRFQSAAASDGTGSTASSLMYSSFISERHPSLAETQSTASEDDLMFEDFARLRLQSVTGSRKAQPSVF